MTAPVEHAPAPELQPDGRPRRALILAGGGVKVAFQAGVLQVWLDELELEFDHVDAASGGVFNLAMLCQGYSGTAVADAWRRFRPLDALDLNWGQLWKTPLFASSLLTYRRFRRNVFRAWALDFDQIRNTSLSAVFNVYNFSRHRLEAIPASAMSPEMLLACVSLPGWFPPVVIDGDTYIDSVYLSDANLEDAILNRGADELWVIWTVSDRGTWFDGIVHHYFQVIETSAVGRFRAVMDRIEANNDAIAAGGRGEFGRPIRVEMLQAEVPLNYLLNLSADRNAEAVNLGVDAARRWAAERGLVAGRTGSPPHAAASPVGLRFTETMRGWVTPGQSDPAAGADSAREERARLTIRLTIDVEDIERFVRSPEHEAPAEGWVDFGPLGGRMAVEQARFNLFVTDGDPFRKRMRYGLHLRNSSGTPFTLYGEKRIDAGRITRAWRDTTTLFTRVYAGHISTPPEPSVAPVAAGIVRISPPGFMRQLTTFRFRGRTVRGRAAGAARFGLFFVGRLWDAYARRLLPWAPI